jgi:hypothetical protein
VILSTPLGPEKTDVPVAYSRREADEIHTVLDRHERCHSGIVKLFADEGVRGTLGRDGWLWRCGQAAVGASPVTWFQVVNRVVISWRYWTAVSR